MSLRKLNFIPSFNAQRRSIEAAASVQTIISVAFLWIVTYIIFHYVGWWLYAFANVQWDMGNKGLLWFLVHILQFPTPLPSGLAPAMEKGPMEILLMIYAFVLAIGVHVLILKKLRKKEKESKGGI